MERQRETVDLLKMDPEVPVAEVFNAGATTWLRSVEFLGLESHGAAPDPALLPILDAKGGRVPLSGGFLIHALRSVF